MPYNVLICKNCETVQNKYIEYLSTLYETNHLHDYSSTKTTNKQINGIIEVGTCHDVLSRKISNKYKTNYTIIEPSFTNDKTKLIYNI